MGGRRLPGGMFIVFEGGEATGKTTQARMLHEWLRESGWAALLTREPGDTPAGREIREMVLNRPDGYLSPPAELLLLTADKAEHVRQVIRPALADGTIVISDRYVDSSFAYQGAGRGLDTASIGRVSAWATDGVTPDLTVLLDLPVEDSRRRMRDRNPDRLEREPESFHHAVRECYLRLSRERPDGYTVVDAGRTTRAVAAEIRATVTDAMASLRAAPGRCSRHRDTYTFIPAAQEDP